ncbi:DUF1304 domain-containing protein [Marinoscillum sp.]|uniref:DUF1304 domain-containing protein n=1 Tax=Marinoscillum sp. TaxID=2024838 RepID=UPI003BACD43D
MNLAIQILTAVIALFHVYILWLEMFAWTTRGVKVFGSKAFPTELFPKTKTLAANQGLYNGFLAAGLIWSFLIEDPVWSENVRLFFLSCVAVAGIYGGLTASRKILIVQALPALVTILLVIIR